MPPITINDLITRVRIQIRDNGTINALSDFEITQFIQDAIMDFSKYRPRKRPYALTLQPGIMQYNLPDDWMYADKVSFNKAVTPQPPPDPLAYALPYIYTPMPLNAQITGMQYNWYDEDQSLIINIAPISAITLNFDYFAFNSADDTKVTIPQQWQFKALLPAYEKALRSIATDQAVKLQKYKMGGRDGVEIDDSKIAENLLNQANDYRDQYRKEVIFKPYGTSGGGDS